MKTGLWILSILILALFLPDFCQKKTKGFIQSRIASTFPLEINPSIENSEQALSALDQPFYFLRKGNSAFVLISSDQKYILKFLRKSPITPCFWSKIKWVEYFFPSNCAAQIEKKEKAKEILLTSYRLATHELKKQTGILYSHLAPTSNLKKEILFYDNLKVKHTISADATAFALQKKADPFCPYFKTLANENKKEEMEALLKEFAGVLFERAQKGIFDNDLSPHYNLGIFEGHFLTFDLDGLKPCTPPANSIDLQKHMLQDGKKMIKWLKSIDPTLPGFLKEEVNKLSDLS